MGGELSMCAVLLFEVYSPKYSLLIANPSVDLANHAIELSSVWY